jgi:hypothetical protein
MDVRYLVFSLFFLVSCLPTATVSRGNLSQSETSAGTNGGTTTPKTSLNWNYLGEKVETITINISNLNNAYLVGTPVEDYLSDISNFNSANYCLVSSFTLNGTKHELRSRIVPLSYYDFVGKRIVKTMRVDFQDVTNSQTFCQYTSKVLNNSGNYETDPSMPLAANIHFNPSQVCTNCGHMLSTSKIKVFKVNASAGEMLEISNNALNTSRLNLQLDMNYSITTSAGTCSNSNCMALGYDCCLDNQCVKDGHPRPAASSTYSSLYQTAEIERLQNPLAYLNYSQLYYICGSTIPSTGGSGGTVTTYDEAFLKLKKDYQCIQHIKNQATSTPFHQDILTTLFNSGTDCLTGIADANETYYYQNVFKRLYTSCGCNRTALSEMITNCPNYDYTITAVDTLGSPAQIDCFTPHSSTNTMPENQSVSFSSRSAPHRFFNSTGEESTPTLGVNQEGDEFSYLDEEKVLPQQENFSMNAILGQMSVSLDQTLPAKIVHVEYDSVYLLSTTSGNYTPCPSCAKDSWYTQFSAYPSSSMGTGLQAIGHTTQRDAFSNNTTGGNFEDTIFGRACWLPPTMIPFSHGVKSTVASQRSNRLKTQAALFVNGYQRDWYGFNKGALIGSFDGVTWFAIGKGRIVRASSKKLFLAINAPFADLATPTMHVVSVAAYDGITQAATMDYHPEYHQSHPYQNEAGNCQKYHLCSTDTDCITTLGWEYACADVKDLKTTLPVFDVEANETANASSLVRIEGILQQKSFSSSSTKRCLYRGAGALCHTDSGSLPTTDLNKKKVLTCGPNFYCAQLSTNTFNTKLARYASALEEIPASRNHFFGKDANILGRPLDYMSNASLSSDVKLTLIENGKQIDPTLQTNMGLCRPGKNLPTISNQLSLSNPFNQHMSADPLKRTDFIGQIGSCHSGLFTTYRHTSCPVLNSDGNYEMFAAATIATGFHLRATQQNACGLESLVTSTNLNSSVDTIQNFSPFKMVEAKPLHSQIILEPTLARDACLRRAGAVCHNDFDCSPHKLHAGQIDLFAKSYFGNDAEKNYWSEYLICGQTDPRPNPFQTEDFKNYDMSKNRCCREVGLDLTTYTSDIPVDTFVSAARPYDPVSAGLKMSLQPGLLPNDPKRYSRLSTVEGIGTTKPILSSNIGRTGNTLDAGITNVATKNQWKTLTEANQESCCGGGWMRKFSDGSNNWELRDRLVLDVTNFRCINARTPLITTPEDLNAEYPGLSVSGLVSLDYGDYCKDSTNTNGNCAQYGISNSLYDIVPSAGIAFNKITIDTMNPDYSSSGNPDFYFQPRSADAQTETLIDTSIDLSSFPDSRTHIAITLPSYVTKDFDNDYLSGTNSITLVTANESQTKHCSKNTSYNPLYYNDLSGIPSSVGSQCYYRYDSTTRVLKIGMNQNAWNGTFNDKKVGVKIIIDAPGSLSGLSRSGPGSSVYYLKRLGRLELSGIPQISFELLTCNDNSNRVLPGIFDASVTTKSLFQDPSFSWNQNYVSKTNLGSDSLQTGFFTNQYGLQHNSVFSANDFKCCAPLGSKVTQTSKCCSGYGILSGNTGQSTCSLPSGTNLMVYFNRFVSNEGRQTDGPGGGLGENDFEEVTGEPKINSTVSSKIRSLGEAYCSSGSVRQGGAFGSFVVQPQGTQTNLTSTIYNIVDSHQDIGQNANAGVTVLTGYSAFQNGFRWNHHLYCDD